MIEQYVPFPIDNYYLNVYDYCIYYIADDNPSIHYKLSTQNINIYKQFAIDNISWYIKYKIINQK